MINAQTTVQGIKNWENANNFASCYGLKIKMTPGNIEPGDANKFRLIVDNDVYTDQGPGHLVLTQANTIEEIQSFMLAMSEGINNKFLKYIPQER